MPSLPIFGVPLILVYDLNFYTTWYIVASCCNGDWEMGNGNEWVIGKRTGLTGEPLNKFSMGRVL